MMRFRLNEFREASPGYSLSIWPLGRELIPRGRLLSPLFDGLGGRLQQSEDCDGIAGGHAGFVRFFCTTRGHMSLGSVMSFIRE